MLCYPWYCSDSIPTNLLYADYSTELNLNLFFYNLTLFFRLFYFTLFLSIYINYMYIALFLHITIKNKNTIQRIQCVAVIYEILNQTRNQNDTESRIRIELSRNCAKQINQNEPNQQNNLLISCITHYDGMAHTLYNQNPMLPQPITPQKAYHAFITWALVVAVTMPWF